LKHSPRGFAGIEHDEQLSPQDQESARWESTRAIRRRSARHARVAPTRSQSRTFSSSRGTRPDAHGVAGDRHAFQQLVRIVSEQKPILERSWLTFGTIADQIFCRTGILRHGLPFHAGWKAGTASTAKGRPLDLGDDL